MAKIVLGSGTSHTPMLLASDATLERFIETDQKIKHRDKEGRQVTYGDLLEKADPKLAHMVAPEHLVARQNVARDAIKHLQHTLSQAKLDALIVMGDDQDESYKEDCRPAFAIYYGDTIRNSNEQHENYRARFPEWYVQNRQGFFEDQGPRDYPVHSGLAVHLIETLMDTGFDIAASKTLPKGEGEGHAIAYVHRFVMDANKPVPAVPIFLNTYFAPEPAASAALLSVRPGRAQSGGSISRRRPCRHPRLRRLEPFPGRRGFRPRYPQGLRRQGCKISADACRATSCMPARRKSSTGSPSPAPPSTSISTGSNTCPAIARPPAPAPA